MIKIWAPGLFLNGLEKVSDELNYKLVLIVNNLGEFCLSFCISDLSNNIGKFKCLLELSTRVHSAPNKWPVTIIKWFSVPCLMLQHYFYYVCSVSEWNTEKNSSFIVMPSRFSFIKINTFLKMLSGNFSFSVMKPLHKSSVEPLLPNQAWKWILVFKRT